MKETEYHYKVTAQWKTLYGLLCLISILCSSVIPVIYRISKRTRHHPAGILVCICMFEIISCFHLMIWAMDIGNLLYFVQYQTILKIYTFGFYHEMKENTTEIKNIQCYQNQMIYFLAFFFEYNYYLILCIDMIITLKKPFISGKQRMKYYHLYVFISSMLLEGLTAPEIIANCNNQKDQKPQFYVAYRSVVFTQALFYLMGSISLFMAIQDIRKDSIIQKKVQNIQKAKIEYFKNQMLIVILLFIVWTLPFVNNLYLRIQGYNEFLNNISFCILLSEGQEINNSFNLGFFLALIRLNEPFFRKRLKIAILHSLNIASEAQKKEIDELEKQDNEHEDVWNYSLATLISKFQNQHLVKNILYGIIQCRLQNEISNQLQFSSAVRIRKQLSEVNIKHIVCDDKAKIPNIAVNETDLSVGSTGSNRSQLLPKGSNNIIKVTEFAPQIFEILRNQAGVNQNIAQSLNINNNLEQIKLAQQSMGKSGSFFFFSYDSKLILKTLTPGEKHTLLKQLLRNYIYHIIQNPETTLVRIYGVYTINIKGISNINLVLMENSLSSLEQMGSVSKIYDLKGSLVHRYVEEKPISIFQSKSKEILLGQISMIKQWKPVVLKDLNFLKSNDLFLGFKKKMRDQLLQQIKIDVEFLKESNLMDYSLLVGISEDIENERLVIKYTIFQVGASIMIALRINDKKRRLSFCIIDYLQAFNWVKYLEHRYKTVMKSKEKQQLISCVMPKQYSERFYSFINSLIISIID